MTAEDLFIDDSRYRQTIEAVSECFPQFYVIPSFTCYREERRRGANENTLLSGGK